MTRTPVVGEPSTILAPVYVPGAEALAPAEIRVTVLGSGDPWIRRSQASGSLLIEVGNPENDFFFFDLGSGSLANFTSLLPPVEATTKVFLEYAGLRVVFSGDTRPCRHVVEAARGADLLIHECFQSPAVFARATGLPAETALQITRLAHTIPEQMGKNLDLTRPRMGALWHLDVTLGGDGQRRASAGARFLSHDPRARPAPDTSGVVGQRAAGPLTPVAPPPADPIASRPRA